MPAATHDVCWGATTQFTKRLRTMIAETSAPGLKQIHADSSAKDGAFIGPIKIFK
jgi:hypothetical protein